MRPPIHLHSALEDLTLGMGTQEASTGVVASHHRAGDPHRQMHFPTSGHQHGDTVIEFGVGKEASELVEALCRAHRGHHLAHAPPPPSTFFAATPGPSPECGDAPRMV